MQGIRKAENFKVQEGNETNKNYIVVQQACEQNTQKGGSGGFWSSGEPGKWQPSDNTRIFSTRYRYTLRAVGEF